MISEFYTFVKTNYYIVKADLFLLKKWNFGIYILRIYGTNHMVCVMLQVCQANNIHVILIVVLMDIIQQP